jgi:ABC-type bacteriocin/lantibiotic exporter with double-glycine peptidase domain
MALLRVMFYSIADDQTPEIEHDITSESHDTDCGIRALFLMLQTQKLDISIDELRSQLPKPSSQGYSIGEMRKASRQLGLSLIAEQIELPKQKMNQPAIVYLQRPNEGHFIFIRPVGETGRMIQVLEYPFAPKVMDLDYFVTHSGWKGIALFPAPSFSTLNAVVVSVGISSVAFLVIYLIRRKVRES